MIDKILDDIRKKNKTIDFDRLLHKNIYGIVLNELACSSPETAEEVKFHKRDLLSLVI